MPKRVDRDWYWSNKIILMFLFSFFTGCLLCPVIYMYIFKYRSCFVTVQKVWVFFLSIIYIRSRLDDFFFYNWQGLFSYNVSLNLDKGFTCIIYMASSVEFNVRKVWVTICYILWDIFIKIIICVYLSSSSLPTMCYSGVSPLPVCVTVNCRYCWRFLTLYVNEQTIFYKQSIFFHILVGFYPSKSVRDFSLYYS